MNLINIIGAAFEFSRYFCYRARNCKQILTADHRFLQFDSFPPHPHLWKFVMREAWLKCPPPFPPIHCVKYCISRLSCHNQSTGTCYLRSPSFFKICHHYHRPVVHCLISYTSALVTHNWQPLTVKTMANLVGKKACKTRNRHAPPCRNQILSDYRNTSHGSLHSLSFHKVEWPHQFTIATLILSRSKRS